MNHLYANIILLTVSFGVGLFALKKGRFGEESMNYLLAFSGSFLLSITLLHLIPETVEEIGHKAGLFILIGFFLQLLIQKFTHGVEHGHHHHTHHGHHLPIKSILIGLSVHALMEGIPLGFQYRKSETDISLYAAIAIHKLPEIFIVAVMLKKEIHNKTLQLLILLSFAAMSPVSSTLAQIFGQKYFAISQLVVYMIPIVAGAFLHIATTIFYESGTQQHNLTRNKIIAILLGVALGACSLLIPHNS